MGLIRYASNVAESDSLRCRHVRELVQEISSKNTFVDRCNIPKVIIQYWHDLSNIPRDVKECLDSWVELEKYGFSRVIFGDTSARQFIRKSSLSVKHVKAFDLCYHPAMRCDYFRLCYILINGGFYVDADEVYKGKGCNQLFLDDRLKVQPLCYDPANDRMISPEKFIHQRRYSPDWIFYVNNNPIVSPPHHPVIELALNRATRILLNQAGDRPEIQSTTGPGNLTASLVKHSIICDQTEKPQDFLLLSNWKDISDNRWSLSYRYDKRNWRLL